MTFDGAVVREQGVTFAVVIVTPGIVENRSQTAEAISAFQPHFPGLPVVLMGQDAGDGRRISDGGTSPTFWPASRRARFPGSGSRWVEQPTFGRTT